MNTKAADDLKFKQLNTSSGLSHVSVLSLHQDEDGFIWIGTREGLNKFNGSSVENFAITSNDSTITFSNNIKRITGDNQGKLFLLCTDGLMEYNIKTNVFKTLWYDPDLTNICLDEQTLLVTRKNIIYRLDHQSDQFIAKYTFPADINITSIYKLPHKEKLYMGTTDGFYAYNTQSRQLIQIFESESKITNIYEDSEGQYWVSTWENGLYKVVNDQLHTHYTHNTHDANSISSNFVRECCEDNLGNLWIGTFKGLDKYDRFNEQFTHYSPSKKNGELSHSSVWSIIKDKQGNIWLSTYFGGVNYFNPEYNIHKEYKQSTVEEEGLSSPIIGRMTEDNKNKLWICTEGAGVNVLDLNTGKFKWYLPNKQANSISQNNVKAIHFDAPQNAMWFGTHLGGLNKLNLSTNQFTHYTHDPRNSKSIPSNIVRDIAASGEYLYLATDNGVSRFNKNTGTSESVFANSTYDKKIKDVYDIHIDRNNEILWTSVFGDGIYEYNFNTQEVKHLFHDKRNLSLCSNNINSIYEDKNGLLYLCSSGNGFDIYNTVDNTIKNYTSKDGLINNYVYNITEIGQDTFLITSNVGFSVFKRLEETFVNYDSFNGFPLSNINDNALFISKNKDIFLGGVTGLVSFSLDNLELPTKDYNIFLDKLFINSIEVKPNDNTHILNNVLYKTNHIELEARHNTLDIEVTTNNYLTYNKEHLEYRLEGFSKTWIPLRETDRKITYTNLSPGKYKLVVKNKNSERSNISPATLHITILPPWYKTIWAYLIYATFIISLTVYLIRTYKRRLQLQTSLRFEQEHIKNIEQLNQSKLNFFTNISHEFRTPLTVILGQLNFLLNHETFPTNVYNKILNIYKNGQQLNDLITELLDFRKQEAGQTKLKVRKVDIVEFLNDNYVLFKEFAQTKDISFEYIKSVEHFDLWFDRSQLQKAINNLLSNAFKYTPEKGTVTLGLTITETSCIISVKDSGRGIDTESINHIFERFYQEDNSNLLNAGSGIGLALTKGIVDLHQGTISAVNNPKQGTTFTITLKLGKEHFDPSQIRLDNNHIKGNEVIDRAKINELKPINLNPSSVEEDYVNKDTKLLIVEDNEDLRQTLIDIFSLYYEVLDAPDGEAGLQLIEEEQPDIIISDIVMPKMSGIDLCKAVKNNIDTCHIPVILLTAKTSLEHNLEGLKIGADDYISKPFNIEVLISRCNNLINSRRMLQEIFSKQPQMSTQKLATNPIDKQTLDRATIIIEKNLDNPQFNLKDFAKSMGMSRTNLFNKIKALTGQTPNNFISTMRLKKAAYLLKNQPELNITEIASVTGFSSSHYFSKCFKDSYQKTPSEYRDE